MAYLTIFLVSSIVMVTAMIMIESSYTVLGNLYNTRTTSCNTKNNQVGVSGNLLVLVAVLANKQMQSITNMYIVNLSIADILMCLCEYCY